MIKRVYGKIHYASDRAATVLAGIFGFDLTIWVFFVVPLMAEFLPASIQAKVFYYASGWIQLFALPLMVYVSNKIQRSSDAQAGRQEQIVRENKELSEEIKAMLARHHAEIAELVRKRL